MKAMGANVKGVAAGMIILFTIFVGSVAQAADALVVDESGKVGIGTASPSSNVHILGDRPSVLKIDFNETYYDGEDILSSIEFGSPTGENAGGIRPVSAYIRVVKTRAGTGLTYEDAGLTFGTLPNGTGNLAERMRIDQLGRVGVGTNSPIDDFHVVAGSGEGSISPASPSVATFQRNSVSGDHAYLTIAGGSTANAGIHFGDKDASNDGRIIYDNSSRSMHLATASSGFSMLSIDNTGNVGIGTTSAFGNGQRVLSLGNAASNPTGAPTNAALFYVSGGEMYVYDSSGNASIISPHPASDIEQLAESSDPYPLFAKSTNPIIGKEIVIDKGKAFRLLQTLFPNEEFIWYRDVPKTDVAQSQRQAWKENWICQNTAELEISKDEAFHLVTVTEEDQNQVVEERVTYALKGKDVIEVRTPVYAKRAQQVWQLKEGVRFDTETGRFFLKKAPTEQEAEAAAQQQFEIGLSQWVKDRM